mgnify:CR=1 FL=1
MSWQTFRTVAFLKNFDFEETSLEASKDRQFVSQGEHPRRSKDTNKFLQTLSIQKLIKVSLK